MSTSNTNATDDQQPTAATNSSIFEFIKSHDWDTVQALVESNPAIATTIDPVSGRAPLHMVCSVGSSPTQVIAAVAAAAPQMVMHSDKVYNDTPMHIVCRNSQKTAAKAAIILQHCSNDDILRRNVIGGTCLHSACGHNAVLDVIKLIVRKNPRVLKISSFDGIPPIRGLFFAYTTSIPGVLAVGKMLKGRQVSEGHFDRFWAKADFLALEYFRLTTACPNKYKTTNSHDEASTTANIPNKFVAHGLMHCDAPLNLLKIAFKRDTACATALDAENNTPLHTLVERRPYRLYEREAIQSTLEAFPQAADFANHAGHIPLMLAIRNKIPFENGVDLIFKADMTVVSLRDPETGLVPFQLAATVGGPEAFNTTFALLTALPQTIGF